MALGALALVACAPPPPSGGTGPGTPKLTFGCFRTPATPVANAHVRIAGSVVLNKWTYSESIHYTADCSDPAVTPLEVYPGVPGPTSVQFCQNKFGPSASTSPLLSAQLIPPQIYWGCNF